MKSERLLRDLRALEGSSEKISAISAYFQLHDPKQCTNLWMTALETGEDSRLLNLMYLANDVMQSCQRKKNPAYIHEFSRYLPTAFKLVGARLPAVVDKLERLAGIWVDRHVLSASFMETCKAAVKEGASSSSSSSLSSSMGGSAMGRQAMTSSSIDASASSVSQEGGGEGEEDTTDYNDGELYQPFAGSSSASGSGGVDVPSSPPIPLLPTSTSSSTSTSTSATGGSSAPPPPLHDPGVDAILNGSALEAILEAQARARLCVHAWERISAIPRHFGEGAMGGTLLLQASSASNEAPSVLLERVVAVEKVAKLALLATQLNSRRRAASVHRLSLALGVQAERLGGVEEELGKAEALDALLQDFKRACEEEEEKEEGGGGGEGGILRVEKSALEKLRSKGGGASSTTAITATAAAAAAGAGAGAGAARASSSAASTAYVPLSAAAPLEEEAEEEEEGGKVGASQGETPVGDSLDDLMEDDWGEEGMLGGGGGASAAGAASAGEGAGGTEGVVVGGRKTKRSGESEEGASKKKTKAEAAKKKSPASAAATAAGAAAAAAAAGSAPPAAGTQFLSGVGRGGGNGGKDEDEEEEDAEEAAVAARRAQELLESLEGSGGTGKKWDPVSKTWLSDTPKDGDYWRDH